MHFLAFLEIFRLDMGQISSNLLKEAFATWQHAFLSTNIAIDNICVLAFTKIKIFAFPFSPFLILLLQWLTFYWAHYHFKKFCERIIETGNFDHGVFIGNFALSFSLEFLSILHPCPIHPNWVDSSEALYNSTWITRYISTRFTQSRILQIDFRHNELTTGETIRVDSIKSTQIDNILNHPV